MYVDPSGRAHDAFQLSAANEVGDDELIQDLVAQLLERLQSDLDTTLTKTSHG